MQHNQLFIIFIGLIMMKCQIIFFNLLKNNTEIEHNLIVLLLT